MPSEAWEPDLFNTGRFAALHADRCGPALLFEQPGIGAFQAGCLRPGHFTSPGRGPHGGYDVRPTLEVDGFEAFVADAEAALRRAGARSVAVALPPLCHGPQLPGRLVALCQRGYRVVRQELNQAVVVTGAEFGRQAAHATRKRIGKAVRAGVTAGLLGPEEQAAGYAAVADNRRKKGRPMAMSWAGVQAMQAAFPGRVHVLGARLDGQVVAGAICVAVNARVLYVHAWGEAAGAEALSPVSLLAASAYDLARREGFGLLDLGTSSVDGVADPGLAGFKRSLGAAPSLKLWLERAL